MAFPQQDMTDVTNLQCFVIVWACDVELPTNLQTKRLLDVKEEKEWLKPLQDKHRYTRNADFVDPPRLSRLGKRVLFRVTGVVEFCVYGAPDHTDACRRVAVETALEITDRIPALDKKDMVREFRDDLLALPEPRMDIADTTARITFSFDLVPVDLEARFLYHARCGKAKEEIRLRATEAVQQVGAFQNVNIALTVPQYHKPQAEASEKPQKAKKPTKSIAYGKTYDGRDDALLEAQIEQLSEDIENIMAKV
jgi:hypothetical protein